MSALSKGELKSAFLGYLDWLIHHKLTVSNTLHQDKPSVEATHDEIVSLHKAMHENPDYAGEVLNIVAQRCSRFGEIIFGSHAYYDYGYKAPAPDRLAKECPDPAVRREILSRFLAAFTDDAQALELEGILKKIATDLGLKDRAVFMTIRLAMTGEERTPPLGEVASILKIHRVRSRVSAVLNHRAEPQAAHS